MIAPTTVMVTVVLTTEVTAAAIVVVMVMPMVALPDSMLSGLSVVLVLVAMFVITEAWLMEHRSPRGAWTRDQLAAIDVAWPPVHGWKHRSIGREISDDAKARFEMALRARQAPTLDLFRGAGPLPKRPDSSYI